MPGIFEDILNGFRNVDAEIEAARAKAQKNNQATGTGEFLARNLGEGAVNTLAAVSGLVGASGTRRALQKVSQESQEARGASADEGVRGLLGAAVQATPMTLASFLPAALLKIPAARIAGGKAFQAALARGVPVAEAGRLASVAAANAGNMAARVGMAGSMGAMAMPDELDNARAHNLGTLETIADVAGAGLTEGGISFLMPGGASKVMLNDTAQVVKRGFLPSLIVSGKNIGKESLSEGVEEGATELAHIVRENALEMNPRPLSGENLERIGKAVGSGGIMGAGFHVPGETKNVGANVLEMLENFAKKPEVAPPPVQVPQPDLAGLDSRLAELAAADAQAAQEQQNAGEKQAKDIVKRFQKSVKDWEKKYGPKAEAPVLGTQGAVGGDEAQAGAGAPAAQEPAAAVDSGAVGGGGVGAGRDPAISGRRELVSFIEGELAKGAKPWKIVPSVRERFGLKADAAMDAISDVVAAAGPKQMGTGSEEKPKTPSRPEDLLPVEDPSPEERPWAEDIPGSVDPGTMDDFIARERKKQKAAEKETERVAPKSMEYISKSEAENWKKDAEVNDDSDFNKKQTRESWKFPYPSESDILSKKIDEKAKRLALDSGFTEEEINANHQKGLWEEVLYIRGEKRKESEEERLSKKFDHRVAKAIAYGSPINRVLDVMVESPELGIYGFKDGIESGLIRMTDELKKKINEIYDEVKARDAVVRDAKVSPEIPIKIRKKGEPVQTTPEVIESGILKTEQALGGPREEKLPGIESMVGRRVRYKGGKFQGEEATIAEVKPDGKWVLKTDDGKLRGEKTGFFPQVFQVLDARKSDTPKTEATVAPGDVGVPAKTEEAAQPAADGREGSANVGAGLSGSGLGEKSAVNQKEKTNETPSEDAVHPVDAGNADHTSDSAASDVEVGKTDAADEVDPIEDYGEKIGGAKKDLLSLSDFDSLSPEEQQTAVTKATAWPEDTSERIANGQDPLIAHVVQQIRSAISPVPVLSAKEKADPGQRSAAIRQYLDLVGQIGQRLKAVKTDKEISAIYSDLFNYKQDRNAASQKYWRIAKNRVLNDAFQVGFKTRRKAEKAIKDGWPNQEKWLSRYRVYEIERQLDDKSVRKDWVVRARNDEQRGKEWAQEKNGELPRYFTTKEEAQAEAARRYEGLQRSGSDKQPVRPLNPDMKRIGADHRGGRDVTPEEIAKNFGFRGIEFGNWTNQADRQQSINQAFDALHDLAALMGKPPKALSLDGRLGIAFGSRGSGKFAAHYEPGKVVINLTRTKGAGSLAHEWAHAVDNYFGKMGFEGDIEKYLSHFRDSERAVRDIAGKTGVRPELVAAWIEIHKAIHSSGNTKTRTDFLQESASKDAKRKEPYWSAEHELFARAFETWANQRLEDAGKTSPYLVQGVPSKGNTKDGEEVSEWFKLYPRGAEADKINGAIDALVGELKSETTPEGIERLYSPMRKLGKPDESLEKMNGNAADIRRVQGLLAQENVGGVELVFSGDDSVSFDALTGRVEVDPRFVGKNGAVAILKNAKGSAVDLQGKTVQVMSESGEKTTADAGVVVRYLGEQRRKARLLVGCLG
jgi:hypothetical protein